MARSTSVQTVTRLIEKLRAQRQTHLAAVAKIDAVFAGLGIVAEPAKRRGRRPNRLAALAPKSRRRRRRRFTENAETFVLRLLKTKTLATAQINDAWEKAGRGGVANNMLTKLAQGKKIKRASIKGERGSRYRLA